MSQTSPFSDKITENQDGSLSLLDTILHETKIRPSDEGYDSAKQGIEAFLTALLKPEAQQERLNSAAVDHMVAEIDKKLSAQTNAILHHPEFQKLESSWRGLKFLIDKTDFSQNIKIEIFNASKHELLEDFEDAPEVTLSGLYKAVYTEEYGQFGGQPIGAMLANYSFGPSSKDVKLLRYVASVASMAHAPFISAASQEFFGIDHYDELPNIRDINAIFEGPKYAKWNSFRESEDSRYVSLTLPRFLLRLPYSPENNPVQNFNFTEEASEDSKNYLWGNTAFAMGTRLTASFANYRWCPNIIGPQSGGAVEDLPLHLFEMLGQTQAKIPTEVLVSDRREYELAEQGFIALTMRKDTDNAAFFSANSVQKPKFFSNTPEGKQASLNYRLGTELPYLFIVSRLAHYIKVLQRENIGSWNSRGELEAQLNGWIKQYISDQENPSADVRSRRPLRRAQITVEDVDGETGWYRVELSVQPHFKYMGADFTLSLVGKLDKD